MEKDFQKWHSLKSSIHHEREALLFRAREIWWCSLGANIGVGQDGKHDLFERPVRADRHSFANENVERKTLDPTRRKSERPAV